ncbi:MAG: superoxide dismutase [Sediminibacterium sp.]|jgi:Fe-Mn family superoxide dismutase|nr:superoxide dismutase [Hydrotalea sp.]MCU0337891.1 superoxide dismutase [Sediminibacterium sp.]
MKTTWNRRKFIIETSKAAAVITALPSFVKPYSQFFNQTPLPYSWNALEPFIDAATMEIHYTKHAAAYSANFKQAIEAEIKEVNKINYDHIFSNIERYSVKMRNNGGGHYNHELFWSIMKPGGAKEPQGELAKAITMYFGDVSKMKKMFTDAALQQFGSGWAWLIKTPNGGLSITSTPNQDNPLMSSAAKQGTPILGLDVWEHAYYLKYQNKRAAYIEQWWNVVNWNEVGERYNPSIA